MKGREIAHWLRDWRDEGFRVPNSPGHVGFQIVPVIPATNLLAALSLENMNIYQIEMRRAHCTGSVVPKLADLVWLATTLVGRLFISGSFFIFLRPSFRASLQSGGACLIFRRVRGCFWPVGRQLVRPGPCEPACGPGQLGRRGQSGGSKAQANALGEARAALPVRLALMISEVGNM